MFQSTATIGLGIALVMLWATLHGLYLTLCSIGAERRRRLYLIAD